MSTSLTKAQRDALKTVGRAVTREGGRGAMRASSAGRSSAAYRNLVEKGLAKVTWINVPTMAYTLTPKGLKVFKRFCEETA